MKLTHKTFKSIGLKGKQYVEVKERLQYLSSDFEGEYSINTDYTYYPERKMWVVKATLTLELDGKTSTYTGLAQEVESDKFSQVNFTSALENAETSAVGRACAMAGIGIDISIASADEVKKAQNRPKAEATPEPALDMEKGAQVASERLRDSKTVQELAYVWKGLHKDIAALPEVIAVKDEVKGQLS